MKYDLKTFDFELPDIEGNKYRLLSLLKQKPVLLLFYKYNCPTCRFILPFVQRLYGRHSNQYAYFLAVAQDGIEETREMIAELNLNFPIALEPPPFNISRKYELVSVPTTILIGQDGTEILRFIGFQRVELEKLNFILPGLVQANQPLFSEYEEIPEVKPG